MLDASLDLRTCLIQWLDVVGAVAYALSRNLHYEHPPGNSADLFGMVSSRDPFKGEVTSYYSGIKRSLWEPWSQGSTFSWSNSQHRILGVILLTDLVYRLETCTKKLTIFLSLFSNRDSIVWCKHIFWDLFATANVLEKIGHAQVNMTH